MRFVPAALVVSVLAAPVAMLSVTPAPAYPPYLAAFEEKYPNSTLPLRMEWVTGLSCNVCHHPGERFFPGSCYREDLKSLLAQGMSIEQALDAADGLDSDGDGVPNGVEINLVRDDLPGEVGFHPGLIGPLGTDPCGRDPGEVVTGQLETPPGCYADCDGNNRLDIRDFFCFQSRFASGDDEADCDRNGRLDIRDFFCFQAAFAAGC